MALNKRNINNIFYIFVTTHLILWTVVPTFTNSNLPLDTNVQFVTIMATKMPYIGRG